MDDFEDMFGLEEDPQSGQEINEPQEEDEETYETTEFNADEEGTEDVDYIDLLLKAKGIDRNKIQYYDENNELVETDFDSLTNDLKFDILNDTEQPVLPSDEELEVINYLRSNNMSLKDFADWQKQVGVEEYLSGQHLETDLDGYSDDEIIAYDFIQRFGEDMTDEEIDAEIERLHADPEAYAKRVALLRDAYKNEELARAKLYEEQQATQRQEAESRFIDAYNEAARSFNDVLGITLDDNDRAELLDFVLTKDQAGRTGLSKALDNPSNVLYMAWSLLHGEEASAATIDYFKHEISKRERNGSPRVISRNKQAKLDPFSLD